MAGWSATSVPTTDPRHLEGTGRRAGCNLSSDSACRPARCTSTGAGCTGRDRSGHSQRFHAVGYRRSQRGCCPGCRDRGVMYSARLWNEVSSTPMRRGRCRSLRAPRAARRELDLASPDCIDGRRPLFELDTCPSHALTRPNGGKPDSSDPHETRKSPMSYTLSRSLASSGRCGLWCSSRWATRRGRFSSRCSRRCWEVSSTPRRVCGRGASAGFARAGAGGGQFSSVSLRR
jgi:hypothetical protein